MSAAPTLRDAHRDLTRSRIVEAALTLFEAAGDEMTLARVAAAAGLTERTLYRHFSSRDELMAAVWVRVNEIVRTPNMPDTPERLIAQPMQMFPEFDAQERLIRAIVSTPQGRELRLSVNAERQAAIRKAVTTARPDLGEPGLTRLCAAVQLLDSSFAWAVMKDYWGLDGVEAGAAASDAIAALLAAPASPQTRKEKKS